MYAKAVAYASLTGHEIVLDLYCGTGTIALCMAKHAKTVIGVEVVESAVLDALENARTNQIENASFIFADAANAVHQLDREGISPDVIVVDPPRKGLASDAIDAIVAMSASRLVYISCNPATLARDLRLFAERGYQTAEVTPVDMFPRCAHVECVALLCRQ